MQYAGYPLDCLCSVRRVDGQQPPVIAMAELIAMLGLSRTWVARLVKEDPAFPTPYARLRMGTLWRYEDVAAWATAGGRAIHPIPPR